METPNRRTSWNGVWLRKAVLMAGAGVLGTSRCGGEHEAES